MIQADQGAAPRLPHRRQLPLVFRLLIAALLAAALAAGASYTLRSLNL